MRNYLVAALLLTTGPLIAQNSIQQEGMAAQSNLNALVNGAAAVLPTAMAEGVKGSPYVNKNWLPARLQMRNGVPMAPVPLKYDVLNHRLLMLPFQRKDSLILNDRQLVSFVLEEPAQPLQPARLRTFRRFAEAPVSAQKDDYVEVLHQGRYTLLKRYVKLIRKANIQGAYNTGERFDEIEDKNAYYLLRPDGQLVPVKLGLKPLQAAAPELSAALKAAPGASAAKTDDDWAAVLQKIDKPVDKK